MICPLVVVPPMPPWPAEPILRVGVAALGIETSTMPAFLDGTEGAKGPEDNLYNRTLSGMRRMDSDAEGILGGLAYKGIMRWQTAFALVDGTRAICPAFDFPVLSFHDPEDKVVPVAGSHRVVEESAEGSEFVPMANGRHDLFGNTEQVVTITEKVIEWAAAI